MPTGAPGTGRTEALPDFLQADRGPVVVTDPPGDTGGAGRVDRVPGEVGLWVLVFGDLAVFGAFFLAYLAARRADPDRFAAPAGSLDPDLGTVNVVVLLVGSVALALAVARTRTAPHRGVGILWLAPAGLAVVFALIKVGEYRHLVVAGHTPGSGLFFTYYFVLTGIHLLHLAVASVLVAVVGVRALRSSVPSAPVVEGVATYWHLVDVLWIVLFALLYVVPIA